MILISAGCGAYSRKNGMVVSSEELLLKVLQFIMATNPIKKLDTLFVLTIPSTTPDLQGAEKFLKTVAKKVYKNCFIHC